jgi:hypothetical protein
MRIGDAPFLSPFGPGTGRVDLKAVDLAAWHAHARKRR